MPIEESMVRDMEEIVGFVLYQLFEMTSPFQVFTFVICLESFNVLRY